MSGIDAPAGRTPVTVLTGFLGSGKTTLVNHILRSPHGLRIGVIVNDFGDLAVDGRLVEGARGTVLELANGCVCCASQGDLWRALADLLAAEPPPEAILVETSGLADPVPVVRALEAPSVREAVTLDAVITVVDAAHFDRNLERADVAFTQIACGDLLLVNKCDLVEPAVADRIEAGIRRVSPGARVLRCVSGDADPALLLGIGPSRSGTPRLADHAPGHAEAFSAVTLSSPRPIDPGRLEAFLARLPATVLRGKGIFHVAAQDERWVFHQVGERSTIVAERQWAAGEPRETALVFIGEGLSRDEMLADLNTCLDRSAA